MNEDFPSLPPKTDFQSLETFSKVLEERYEQLPPHLQTLIETSAQLLQVCEDNKRQLAALEGICSHLSAENQSLRQEVASLKSSVRTISTHLTTLSAVLARKS